MSSSTYSIPAPDELGASRHPAVGAWFFGPRAENFDHLARSFETILGNQREARQTTYPDSDFITEDIKASNLYTEQIARLDENLGWVTKTLSKTSVPFWSPRYNAHMAIESPMPAVVGYLAGLLHNQNNVATEASALTTWLETQVGKGLSYMLGYNIQLDNPDSPKKPLFIPGHKVPVEDGDPFDDEPLVEKDRPIGWGHITCGGSVANLESIWAARNLKFYPLSLKLAIEEDTSILAFLKDKFRIETCDGTVKLFAHCTTWELLNLKPSTVFNIPTMLYDSFGVSQTTLTNVLANFSIQTVGKDSLEKNFAIVESPQIFVGTTKHYSWPKGAAIAGIGRAQVKNVAVDEKARMDPAALRRMLEDALAKNRAVYAVIAIIGSTEHGAVDPLVSVLKLRQQFEKKGLSFVVHCDGAWGGYFASCIRETDIMKKIRLKEAGLAKGASSFVPTMALTPYTRKQLAWYGRADSITIDPHKSGYCPYPTGGLCYRDGRMRYLVTWTSPVVYRGEVESIGVYGVEGSKPGASAVGTWLSHRIIGLDRDGYGTLLGEAIFTCARLYCHWATMEPPEIPVLGKKARVKVTPFTMLPAESSKSSEKEIEAQKKFIRDHIIGKDNEEIFENDEASKLISELGGDLQINAFAVNFEIDGKMNEDVVEANYLNNRIFNRTSITDWQDEKKTLKDVRLFLTSTILAQEDYGSCLDTFKRRLGLCGKQDLYTLINVTMNPWATSGDFVQKMAEEFQRIANEELLHVVSRNVETVDTHCFIIQGVEGDRVCGVYLPMFNMQNHRWQLIISCALSQEALSLLREHKAEHPRNFFTFANVTQGTLEDLITPGSSFKARIENASHESLIECDAGDVEIIYKHSLEQKHLSSDYPEHMVLRAYSAQDGAAAKHVFHVDHMLNAAIDIQLNSDSIKFKAEGKGQDEAEELVAEIGAWFRLIDVHERVLQPLLQEVDDPKTVYNKPGLSWKPGAEFKFEAVPVEYDPTKKDAPVIFTGTLTLGQSVFADACNINADAPIHADHKKSHGEVNGVYQPNQASSLLGLQQSNASGLVAEYPNSIQMPELRLRNQANKMRHFKESILKDAPEDLSYPLFGGTLRAGSDE